MSKDCLPSQPSAWKRSLAAGAMLFCFLCFHDALLAHAPKTSCPLDVPSRAVLTGFQQSLHRDLSPRLRHLSTNKQTASQL